VATIIALIWANSPFGDSYSALWQYEIGFATQSFEFKLPLILWINDLLMAVFFFLIGLEVKRELVIGELNTLKKTAFPLVAAIGGMVVPVAIYLFFIENTHATKGWGIPMATDIAFSLAVLNVLGKRVPLSLKIFLTAFAIVDDIGAVLVIAAFYSTDINIVMISSAMALLVLLYVMSFKGFYSKSFMVLSGIVIWALFFGAGIHPTVAGILLAFSVPIRQSVKTANFISNLKRLVQDFKKAKVSKDPVLSDEQVNHIGDLQYSTSKFQSPLQKLEHSLHGFVAYFVIPVFALSNAGVALGSGVPLDYEIIVLIAVSLFVGKSVGVTLLVFLAHKIKLIEMPSDITYRHVLGVSFIAGIGFTMAIFIANLAFDNEHLEYIDSAKVGIIIGSIASGLVGFLILKLGPSKRQIET
jgi:NhaA family Na+:H+ antiporter